MTVENETPSTHSEDATEESNVTPLHDITPNAAPEAETTTDDDDKFAALQDQHLRLAADFENFRKRVLQEREALLKYGAQSTVNGLLPILDNLERANQSLSETSDPKMLFESFAMLSKQILEALESQGLKKIDTVGTEFDPNFHEASTQITTTEHPENHVANEFQAGYMIHDRVLRPALVAVATPPEETEVASDNPENPFAQAATDTKA